VKASKGAAGIDGQTIGEFTRKQEENLSMLMHELKTKNYRPQPVKRVEIPEPGGCVDSEVSIS
jgi:retron-type reverse transcriptase